jgi:hypothetical protein
MNCPAKAACLFAVGLLLTTVSLAATKLTVSNYGTDSVTCGTPDNPCRSITQAIENAGSGDTIIIGPGRYGSLNNDGGFTGPGDEHPANGGMVDVSKIVTIVSRDGADVTLIDAGTNVFSCVTIEASRAVFGAKGKGFTLVGGAAGVFIQSGASHVTVEGNRAVGTGSDGFSSIDGTGSNQFIGNVACACGGNGFAMRADGSLVQGNVALRNIDNGFAEIGRNIVFLQNVSIGNHQDGLDALEAGAGAPTNAITGSSFIGNRFSGVNMVGPFTLTDNDFSGNAIESGCDVASFQPLKAPKNFFGLTASPAVLDCATNVNLVPFATKEIKVKVIEP